MLGSFGESAIIGFERLFRFVRHSVLLVQVGQARICLDIFVVQRKRLLKAAIALGPLLIP